MPSRPTSCAASPKRDILAGTIDPATLRFVTHKDVDDDGIAATITALDELRTT